MESHIVVQGNLGSIIGSPFNQCNIRTVNVNTTVFPATQGSPNDDQHVASPSTRQYREQQKVIKDQLTARQKMVYQDVNRVTPATWNKKYDIDIKQVFVNLILLKLKKEQIGEKRIEATRHTPEPTTLTEVLGIIKSTDSCKVLITGKAGMGKTTLLRHIAYNWATEVDKMFDGKILFLINIRDIKESTNFLDVIMKQLDYAKEIILKNDLPNDSVERFLAIHANEIVILLDGYDELERDAKDPINLFKGLELGKSTVLVTSRPENIDELVKNCDLQIEVKGFNETHIREYIHKYFASINKIELGKSLIQELGLISADHAYPAVGNRKVALEFCSSPLILLKICTIWRRKQHIPEDLSDLFKELFCCVLNQYKNRAGNKFTVSQFNRIPKEHKSAILALGKCMYECLQENILSIDKYELIKILEHEENLVDLALKPGLVYRNNPVSPDDLNEIYTTPHKLLSEALAGFYLAEQCHIGNLKFHDYEMIRSNKYLHMTRVLAIGFLGANAGKLLKSWFMMRETNYYSLAQYFRYVKKEHQEQVLRVLDHHMSMSTEIKVQSEEMCHTFENILRVSFDKTAIVSRATYLIQLMSQCCVEYENHPKLLEQDMLSMIKKCTEISHVCAMLVHVLFILQGICTNHQHSCDKMFKYLGNWEDTEIDTLSATMENFKFKYTFNKFNVFGKMNPKFLIHFLKNAPELIYLSFHSSGVTGVVLNQVFNDLLKGQSFLKLCELDLSENNLCDRVSLVNLIKTAPKLKLLKMSQCSLSGTILNKMFIECQDCQLVSNLKHLDISCNHLRDLNEAFFAIFLNILPKLESLDISYNHMTGKFGCNLLNMCVKFGRVLQKLNLEGNNLSNVNGVSLLYLMRALNYRYGSFKWSNYSLSAVNLQDLVNSCGVDHVLIITKLDLSEINLAPVSGRTLANLFKISPQLNHVDMTNCNLSGSTLKDALNECNKIGVVLKDNIIRLKNNDLSDIDGISLVRLVTMIEVSEYDTRPKPFTWTDYCLLSVNLQDLVNSCGVESILTWTDLDLSEINLALINGRILARLIKISPQLRLLYMRNCNLSGSSIRDLLNECDKIGVVLKDNMLRLKKNDLSNIDGVSLAKLVRVVAEYGDDHSTRRRNYANIDSSNKPFVSCNYCLSAVNLQDLVHSCGVDGRFTWTLLDLSGISLASVSGKILARLIKISPQLTYLNMSKCNLSGSTIRDVLNECDKIGVVLKKSMVRVKGNDLSDIDGVSLARLVRMIDLDCRDDYSKSSYKHFKLLGNWDSSPETQAFVWKDYFLLAVNLQDIVNSCVINSNLTWNNLVLNGINLASIKGRTIACLFKISPYLTHLDMRNCSLSGSSIKDLLNECDKTNVLLKGKLLRVENNDLSDIDGKSLAKLVRIIAVCRDDYSSSSRQQPFIWNDYCLLAVNLQDLVNSCDEDGRLPWSNLDLSGINLASVNRSTLARLIKISPQLSHIDMRNCSLPGSSITDVLNECDKIDVVLKGNILKLKGTENSDRPIDDVSLAK